MAILYELSLRNQSNVPALSSLSSPHRFLLHKRKQLYNKYTYLLHKIPIIGDLAK